MNKDRVMQKSGIQIYVRMKQVSKMKESGWTDIDTVAGDMIQRAKGVKERGRPEKAERAFHLSGISKRERARESGWLGV